MSKIIHDFLYIIYKDLEMEELLRYGYSYSQIATCLLDAKKQKLIIKQDGEYVLTETGSSVLKQRKPFEKINKLKEYQIPKIGIDRIYISDKIIRRYRK